MTSLDKVNKKYRLKRLQAEINKKRNRIKRETNRRRTWRTTSRGLIKSKSVCNKKKSFSNEEEALKIARQYKQYTYPCLKCGKFHLSSSKVKEK